MVFLDSSSCASASTALCKWSPLTSSLLMLASTGWTYLSQSLLGKFQTSPLLSGSQLLCATLQMLMLSSIHWSPSIGIKNTPILMSLLVLSDFMLHFGFFHLVLGLSLLLMLCIDPRSDGLGCISKRDSDPQNIS